MALHPDFPKSPYAILDPAIRWFPADETLRDTSMDKLMPPLVPELRKRVKEFRDSGYAGATDTTRSLLNFWFKEKVSELSSKWSECRKFGFYMGES